MYYIKESIKKGKNLKKGNFVVFRNIEVIFECGQGNYISEGNKCNFKVKRRV